MAVHQVVCVNHAPAPGGTHQRITVAEAIMNLRSPYGDRYFTISPSTGRRADVIEGGCERCGQKPYVRTTADGIHDNNLNSLSYCQVA